MSTSPKSFKEKLHAIHPHLHKIISIAGICAFITLVFIGLERYSSVVYSSTAPLSSKTALKTEKKATQQIPKIAPLDTVLYDKLMLQVANIPKPKAPTGTATTTATVASATVSKWPTKGPYPVAGAVLPFNRIIAYYGNFYSTKMGVLGEFETPVMLAKLDAEVKKWQAADPTIPVIPAIHYIGVTAQGSAGVDGKYRARMPDTEIQKAVDLARKIKGIAFIDIQPGLSTVQSEVPYFDKFMMMPDVHLGIDPEFAMTRKGSKKPGTVIGSMDAEDINFVTAHLAKIVKENNLPPKILVIHRFTQGMVTNYQNIIKHPEVQLVIEMDGWGHQSNKLAAYKAYIHDEPIQFTGLKLFYKHDNRNGAVMFTPEQVLKFTPQPLYIQFQ